MTSKKTAKVVCSAHTTPPSGGDARWQIQQFVNKLRKYYIGTYKVFVGADHNLEPHNSLLNALYHRRYGFGSQGNFREAGSYCRNDPDPSKGCRSAKMNHWTHEFEDDKGNKIRRKIDYLFYPPNETISNSAVTHAGLSDHQMLWTNVAF